MTHLIYNDSAKVLDLFAEIDAPSFLPRIDKRAILVGPDIGGPVDTAKLVFGKVAADLDIARILRNGHFWRVHPQQFGQTGILYEGLSAAPTLMGTAIGGPIGAAPGDDFSTRRRLQGRGATGANTRGGFNAYTAPIGAISPVYAGTGPVWGGFIVSHTFGFEAVPENDIRLFCGISTLNTLDIAASGVNPSTILTIPRIGIAKDSFDNGTKALSFQHTAGDGSTQVGKIDLAPANFPLLSAHDGASKAIYQMLIVNAPGSGTVAWMVRKINGRTGFGNTSPLGVGENLPANAGAARGLLSTNIAFSDSTIGEYDLFYHHVASTDGTAPPQMYAFDTWGIRLP